MKKLFLIVALLSGCVSPPPPPSPFEQCVKTVAGDTIVVTYRIKAADWCKEQLK